MTSPYGSFLDQLAYWYYLYIVPTGFNPAKPNGTGAVQVPELHAGPAQRLRQEPELLEVGPALRRLGDDHRLQRQRLPAERADDRRHPRRGRPGGPADRGARRRPASVRTVKSHTGAITPFTMRVDQAPFNDVNVRQAMRLLVDRQQLINSALDGSGTVGADVFSPYDPNYDTSLHRVQDIAQAKSLLKKAGQENLTVQLVTSAVATGTVAMATVLAQQAQAAGVTINLKTVDPTTFFGPNYLQLDLLAGLLQLLALPRPGGPVDAADLPVQRDALEPAPLQRPVPAGERDGRTRRCARRSSTRCSRSTSPRAGTSSRPSSTRSTPTAPRSPDTRPPRWASRCPTSTSSTSRFDLTGERT